MTLITLKFIHELLFNSLFFSKQVEEIPNTISNRAVYYFVWARNNIFEWIRFRFGICKMWVSMADVCSWSCCIVWTFPFHVFKILHLSVLEKNHQERLNKNLRDWLSINYKITVRWCSECNLLQLPLIFHYSRPS